MIVVRADAVHEFRDASQVRTDEHNNLELHEGDRLVHLFNRTEWRDVEIDYAD